MNETLAKAGTGGDGLARLVWGWSFVLAAETALAMAYHSMTRDAAEVLLPAYAATLGVTLCAMDREAPGARQRLHGACVVVAALSLVLVPAVHGDRPPHPEACALAVLAGLVAMVLPSRGSAVPFRRRLTAARIDLGTVVGFALSPCLASALATALRV